MTLVRFTSTWGDQTHACWIDPNTVTGIVAAGLPACTRIDRGNQPCVLVLGTPEDVHAQLAGAEIRALDAALSLAEVEG